MSPEIVGLLGVAILIVLLFLRVMGSRPIRPHIMTERKEGINPVVIGRDQLLQSTGAVSRVRV